MTDQQQRSLQYAEDGRRGRKAKLAHETHDLSNSLYGLNSVPIPYGLARRNSREVRKESKESRTWRFSGLAQAASPQRNRFRLPRLGISLTLHASLVERKIKELMSSQHATSKGIACRRPSLTLDSEMRGGISRGPRSRHIGINCQYRSIEA